MVIKMLDLLHKKCKLGVGWGWGYVRGQMPKNANVICEGSLIIVSKINQGSCLGCLGGDDAPAGIRVDSSLSW